MVFAFEMVEVGNRKFLNTQRGILRPTLRAHLKTLGAFHSFEMVRIAVAFRNKTFLQF